MSQQKNSSDYFLDALNFLLPPVGHLARVRESYSQTGTTAALKQGAIAGAMFAPAVAYGALSYFKPELLDLSELGDRLEKWTGIKDMDQEALYAALAVMILPWMIRFLASAVMDVRQLEQPREANSPLIADRVEPIHLSKWSKTKNHAAFAFFGRALGSTIKVPEKQEEKSQQALEFVLCKEMEMSNIRRTKGGLTQSRAFITKGVEADNAQEVAYKVHWLDANALPKIVIINKYSGEAFEACKEIDALFPGDSNGFKSYTSTQNKAEHGKIMRCLSQIEDTPWYKKPAEPVGAFNM